MLDRRLSLITIAVALASTGPARAQPASLDAVAQRMIAQERVAGASVLVVQHGKVLLHKGYGFADLGLDAPTKDETVYHVVGPMLPFTGVAVMQLVEHGKLALDDELAKYIPEFPMQGHRVTIRQLLNHTAGIVDYHYLGDPIEATSRLPKALDEVMALYAGKKWVNEPGKKWDWSISGFQLLVTVVERASGQSFADYVRTHLFEPAGLKITRALARAALGLPPLPAPPAPPPARVLADASVSAATRGQLAGTFVVKLDHVGDGLHDSFVQYRRTYRVFDESGRLMIQALGEVPERLLAQADGSFAMRSEPDSHITFVIRAGHAASIKLDPSPLGNAFVGDRVGPGDPATFHKGAP